MKLVLKRITFTENETVGKLFVDSVYFCDTLEDCDRKIEDGGEKIAGKTAIPRGTYKVTIDWSNRFQKNMIKVCDVPKFEGVRIHGGVDHTHTEGCPLVGKIATGNTLQNSRITTDKLFKLIQDALANKATVTLTVV